MAAVATLAACADDAGKDGVSSPVPVSTAVTDAQVMVTGTAYAQCARERGAQRLPEPVVRDGRLGRARPVQQWTDHLFQMIDVIAERWGRCADMSTVIGYRILNGGHTWPGAPGATQTVSASTLAWDFFRPRHLPYL